MGPLVLPLTAGLATMRLLDEAEFRRLDALGAKLRAGLGDCFTRAGVPGRVTGVGSLFRIHPMDREFCDYRTSPPEEAKAERLKRLFRRLLERGVSVSPQGLGCLSTPMGEAEIEFILETFAACLKAEA